MCKHFKIDREQLGHFYVTNGFETQIKVAGGGRDVKIDTALRKEIIEVINDLKIDVAKIETFSDFTATVYVRRGP